MVKLKKYNGFLKLFVIFLTLFLISSCSKNNYSLTKIEGKQVPVTEKATETPEIENFIKPYRDHINKDLDSVLAYCPENLDKNSAEYRKGCFELAGENGFFKMPNPTPASKKLYADWESLPQFDFAYEHKGLLEIFQTEKVAEHAHHTVKRAHEIGLTDTELLTQEELFALEPRYKINALGAIYFKCDAHLYPNKLMKQLIEDLKLK